MFKKMIIYAKKENFEIVTQKGSLLHEIFASCPLDIIAELIINFKVNH